MILTLTHRAISELFRGCIWATYLLWAALFVLLVLHLLKKDRHAFRITLLVAFNSVVLVVAWSMVMRLALIVLGPKDATVLRSYADAYFVDLLRVSFFVLLAFAVGNVLYLRFFVRMAAFRITFALFVVQALVLFAASYLSAEYYYLGLLPDTR